MHQVTGLIAFNEWSQAHRWAELAYDYDEPQARQYNADNFFRH